jgi:hypothetical protein
MKRVALPVILSMSLATSGCTLAGVAIGAATPRYERTESPRQEGIVDLGTQIRVRVRSVGSDSVVIEEIDGRYGGIRDGWMSVTDADGHEHELPVSDIVELRVRSGTEWKKGLLLGAAADAVLVMAAVMIRSGADVSIATGR